MQEQELAALREEKASFSQTLEQKVAEAKQSVTNELEQKYKFTIELKSKETEANYHC